MTSILATTPALDLTSCDQEPIRIPGSIRPHGFLLTLPPDGEGVLQASDNLRQHAGVSAAAALRQSPAAIVGLDAAALIAAELPGVGAGKQPVYLGNVQLANGRHFDVLAHRYDSVLLLEFEAASATAAA